MLLTNIKETITQMKCGRQKQIRYLKLKVIWGSEDCHHDTKCRQPVNEIYIEELNWNFGKIQRKLMGILRRDPLIFLAYLERNSFNVTPNSFRRILQLSVLCVLSPYIKCLHMSQFTAEDCSFDWINLWVSASEFDTESLGYSVTWVIHSFSWMARSSEKAHSLIAHHYCENNF
jgi:hypothetical protein